MIENMILSTEMQNVNEEDNLPKKDISKKNLFAKKLKELERNRISGKIFNEILMTSPEFIHERKLFDFENLSKFYDILFEKFDSVLNGIDKILKLALNKNFSNLTSDQCVEIKKEIFNYIDSHSNIFELEDFDWLYNDAESQRSDNYKDKTGVFSNLSSQWMIN